MLACCPFATPLDEAVATPPVTPLLLILDVVFCAEDCTAKAMNAANAMKLGLAWLILVGVQDTL